MGLFDTVGKALSPTSGWANPMSYGFSAFNQATGDDWKDYIPGIGDARAAAEANKSSINQAAINRAFQERMSSTAYQRAMADMRSAGLNPTLAYMQGGASSPSGSQANVQSESKTRLADVALQATTGVGGLRNQATALQQEKQMNESSILLNQANSAKMAAEAENKRVDTQLKKKSVPRAQLEEDVSRGLINGLRNLMKKFQSSSKDVENLNKREPLIKRLGPGPVYKSKFSDWLLKKP